MRLVFEVLDSVYDSFTWSRTACFSQMIIGLHFQQVESFTTGCDRKIAIDQKVREDTAVEKKNSSNKSIREVV